MTTAQLSTTAQGPRAARLLVGQVRYAVVDLWRSRSAFVFTFLLPLIWLVMIGFLAGDELLDETTGLRVMQAATPSAAVLGVLFATMPTVATTLALARESGVLKRVRGTPLPLWAYLAGRVGAAVLLALGAVVVTVGFGAAVYSVEVPWRTVPAALVTAAVAVASLASLGIAVAVATRTAALAQAASMAGAVVLAFVSGVFVVGDLPRWADVVAAVFPLAWFHDAAQAQFDPSASGAGWDVPALAVMTAWALAAAAVAARMLRREPGRAPRTPPSDVAPSVVTPAPATAAEPGTVAVRRRDAGRPATWRLLAGEAGWGLRTAARDPGWLFFAVALPVGLYAFLASITPHREVGPDGFPLTVTFAAGMATWGAGVTGFMAMPEVIALARERGLLKRLRGTPLDVGVLLAGRAVAAVVIAMATGALVVATGVAFFDLAPRPTGVLVGAAVLLLGALCLAACGFALASALPSARAVNAVGLGVLLPVSFLSDVFGAGEPPGWLSAVAAVLPVKPLAGSLSGSLDAAGPDLGAGAVLVLMLWLIAATVVAWRRWSALTSS